MKLRVVLKCLSIVCPARQLQVPVVLTDLQSEDTVYHSILKHKAHQVESHTRPSLKMNHQILIYQKHLSISEWLQTDMGHL